MSASDHSQDFNVRLWLQGIGMEQYADSFEQNHICRAALPELADSDLKECGVQSLGHRKLILAAIREFTQSPAAQTASATSPVEKGEGGACAVPARLGHFELLEEIGHGGMGRVYRAWDVSLGRQVALKLVGGNPDEENPQTVEQVVSEAQRAAAINHPNIVQVYFVGEENGQAYIAMELMEGQSLHERLTRGAMEEKMVLGIARQIAEALAAIHSRRLIHGDIKPQNIFLTVKGQVKLLDFGIAQKENTVAMVEGAILGSAAYLSPERAAGRSENFQSDIYSLGIVIFQALTGMLPFDEEDLHQLVLKRIDHAAPALSSVKPDVLPSLDRLVARMLQRRPEDRHASYLALIEEIKQVEASLGLRFDTARASLAPAPEKPGAVKTATALSELPQPSPELEGKKASEAQAVVLPEPGKPAQTSLWRRLSSSKVFVFSVVLHLVFGLVATVWIVQRTQAKRKLTFKEGPPNPNPSSRAMEHKVNMTRKQQRMSAPAQAQRIVSTGVSKITLPEMPLMASSSSIAPNKIAGMGGEGFGVGLKGAMSAGAGMSGGSNIPAFGIRSKNAACLKGMFYDLKQTRNGKPIPSTTEQAYYALLKAFVSKGWNESIFEKYFRAKEPLYTSQIYIPIGESSEAAKAFNVDKYVTGALWIVIYKARVTAPRSGTFRFVGRGDNVLSVRFNNDTVFDCSDLDPSACLDEKLGEVCASGWQLYGGKWFTASSGSKYDIQILIGDSGGAFSDFLFIEEKGAAYAKRKDDPSGLAYPIFQTNKSPLPAPGWNANWGGRNPEVAPEPIIFQGVANEGVLGW